MVAVALAGGGGLLGEVLNPGFLAEWWPFLSLCLLGLTAFVVLIGRRISEYLGAILGEGASLESLIPDDDPDGSTVGVQVIDLVRQWADGELDVSGHSGEIDSFGADALWFESYVRDVVGFARARGATRLVVGIKLRSELPTLILADDGNAFSTVPNEITDVATKCQFEVSSASTDQGNHITASVLQSETDESGSDQNQPSRALVIPVVMVAALTLFGSISALAAPPDDPPGGGGGGPGGGGGKPTTTTTTTAPPTTTTTSTTTTTTAPTTTTTAPPTTTTTVAPTTTTAPPQTTTTVPNPTTTFVAATTSTTESETATTSTTEAEAEDVEVPVTVTTAAGEPVEEAPAAQSTTTTTSAVPTARDDSPVQPDPSDSTSRGFGGLLGVLVGGFGLRTASRMTDRQILELSAAFSSER